MGRNIGRDETVVGETWGLDSGFRMEGRVVGVFGWREEWLGVFFESYVGMGNLEKKEGRFSLKPLKGVGVFSHWRVFVKYDEGRGKGGTWG